MGFSHKSNPSAFWARIDIRGSTDCWNWTGHVSRNGYGRLSYHGVLIGAHRLAFQLGNAVVLPKMKRATHDAILVLHHCDNRKCCNPSHLFLGTHLDNSHDRIAKGRINWRSGEEHYMKIHPGLITRGSLCRAAKLTESDIPNIRARLASGETMKNVAMYFGVATSTISGIKTSKNWIHV